MSSSEDPEDTDMADDSSEQEFESPPETYNAPDDGTADAEAEPDAPPPDTEEAGPSQSAPTTPTTLDPRRGRQYQDRGIEFLQNPPQFLAAMRQTLFDLPTPIELKPEEFDLYWPFVDNVWVRQHKAGFDRSGKNRTDYYACRLQRPTYTPRKNAQPRDDLKQRRNKKAREGGTCQMRIKTVTYEGEYTKITVQRVGEHSHTHDLDAIDQLKRNTVVMDIGRTEVMKGYMPTSVFNAMKADPNKLNMVGGKFMKVNDVRNASMQWRSTFTGALRPHPDAALSRNLSVMTSRRPPDGAYRTDSPHTGANGNMSAADSTPQVPQSHAPQLPPDTLFFPPTSTYFLQPYLPPVPASDPLVDPLPHVTVAYATSLDSLLSLGPMIPTPISGLPSKAMTHYLRSRHDAILVGVGTAICDDPTLNCRLAGAGGYGGVGWSSHPRPVIIDPGARWDITPESKVLQAAKAGKARAPWIVVQPGASVPAKRVELVQQFGGRYLTLPEVNQRFRLPWEGIFHALAAQGIRSVMVEGGGMVLNELLGREENTRLISSVVLTVAPMYLGYGGVGVVPQRHFNGVGMPVPVVRFKDVRWAPMGEDVVMCGRITRDMPAPAPTPAPEGEELAAPQSQASDDAAAAVAAIAAAAAADSASVPPVDGPLAAGATPGSAGVQPSAQQLAGTPGTPTPNPHASDLSMLLPLGTTPSAGAFGAGAEPGGVQHPLQQYLSSTPSSIMTVQAQAQEDLRRAMQAHARGQPPNF